MEDQSIADLKAIYDYCILQLKRGGLNSEAEEYFQKVLVESDNAINRKLNKIIPR